MNQHTFTLAFFLGAAAISWIGAGFVGPLGTPTHTHTLALAMTMLIAAAYLFGAHELRQFRQITAGLNAALARVAGASASPDNLEDWLRHLPPSLQNAVRLRFDGERHGLPGPVLTPYLVGLLVMLGMLGTFIGMVVTLNGAVFALEGTTDLPSIRSALATPVKGLGLAFGTSVAGVAASAMLGLMSAISRRERLHAAQQLDSLIATELRCFSRVQQRQETYQALQAQTHALPQVVDNLQAFMTQIERMNQQLGTQLSTQVLSNQERFHHETQAVYTELAHSVAASLKNSADAAAAVMASAITGIAADTRVMHEHLITHVAATQTTFLTAYTAAETQRMEHLTGLLDTERAERRHIMATLNTVLAAINHASTEQRAVVDTLVATSATTLTTAAAQFAEQVTLETTRLDAIAAQVTSSAVDVASLSEAFGLAVRAFGDANDKMISHLQRVEAALNRSTTRSDEQLAYYVAQARELIDLSLLAQKPVLDEVRRRPAPAEVS